MGKKKEVVGMKARNSNLPTIVSAVAIIVALASVATAVQATSGSTASGVADEIKEMHEQCASMMSGMMGDGGMMGNGSMMDGMGDMMAGMMGGTGSSAGMDPAVHASHHPQG